MTVETSRRTDKTIRTVACRRRITRHHLRTRMPTTLLPRPTTTRTRNRRTTTRTLCNHPRPYLVHHRQTSRSRPLFRYRRTRPLPRSPNTCARTTRRYSIGCNRVRCHSSCDRSTRTRNLRRRRRTSKSCIIINHHHPKRKRHRPSNHHLRHHCHDPTTVDRRRVQVLLVLLLLLPPRRRR